MDELPRSAEPRPSAKCGVNETWRGSVGGCVDGWVEKEVKEEKEEEEEEKEEGIQLQQLDKA
jgi:hypothetical protein